MSALCGVSPRASATPRLATACRQRGRTAPDASCRIVVVEACSVNTVAIGECAPAQSRLRRVDTSQSVGEVYGAKACTARVFTPDERVACIVLGIHAVRADETSGSGSP